MNLAGNPRSLLALRVSDNVFFTVREMAAFKGSP